jgi:hypothetical protein
MSTAILTFLQGDSQGVKRDMIARCYYEVAQGDPKSGPVAYAVLLDACAECFAKVPQEMQGANEHFQLSLKQAREFQAKLLEWTEKVNASVIATLKDEAARTNANLQTTNELNETIVQKAKDTIAVAQDINRKGQSLADELYLIRLKLQNHEDCSAKTAEAAKTIAETHLVTKELVGHLTDRASFHWMSIGIGIGFISTVIAVHLPWLGFSLLALAVGFFQWMARDSWKFVREHAKKLDKKAKS